MRPRHSMHSYEVTGVLCNGVNVSRIVQARTEGDARREIVGHHLDEIRRDTVKVRKI